MVLLALALGVAGCGSSSSSGTSAGGTSTAQISHAKTKFILHAGLAFGAFHHWIYKPARAGDFAHPFLHKLTIIKAGVAGLFVYHELKLALADARADPTLSKLVAPLDTLEAKISGLAASLKGGHADPSSINQDNGSIGSVSQLASRAGQPVSDLLPSHL